MNHVAASWIYFSFLVSQSSSILHIFPAPQLKICGRPLVNSTVPDYTRADINSPGYPSEYLGPHDCTITISLPDYSWIGFYAADFSLKQPETGCTDSVSIRNQQRPEHETVHCGNITQYEMIFHDSASASSEKIDVHFHAFSFLEEQTTKASQFFLIEYLVADVIHPRVNYNHSKQAVTNGYGYVVSHSDFGSKDVYYESDIDSYFILTDLGVNTVIEIFFITFSLHNSNDCSDRLTISGVSESPSSQEPLELCGNIVHNTEFELVTIDSSITFHFKTNNRNGDKGFLAQYFVKGYIEEGSTTDYTGGAMEKPAKVNTADTNAEYERTTLSPKSQNTEKTNPTKNQKYLYLGLGVGAGNLVVIIFLTLAIVCCVKKRRKRLAFESSQRTRYTDSVRTGPLPPTTGYNYESRTKGKGSPAVEIYDDESAYYSEIGTFQKKREEPDTHYASTNVCGAHFYHIVEEPNDAPPPPTSPPLPTTTQANSPVPSPVPPALPINSAARPSAGPVLVPPQARQDYHLPFPSPATDDSYKQNNNRLNAVRIEYQPRNWKNNLGVERF